VLIPKNLGTDKEEWHIIRTPYLRLSEQNDIKRSKCTDVMGQVCYIDNESCVVLVTIEDCFKFKELGN
jgi:hypothetical protein